MENSHLISCNVNILDALKQINSLSPEPLVLFVVDEDRRMLGTLTDGDVRRALISGCEIESNISIVMHQNFNFIRKSENDMVKDLHEQRKLNMKLVPILDYENHIVSIINLEKYLTILPIDAVMMAGGKGIRLRPLTEHTPKPLLEVGGKSIIDHNVDRLIEHGVNHINVTVNYLADQLVEHFAQPRNGIQVKTFREQNFYGTIGGIKIVDNFFNDTILVMNSDLFTNIDYEDFYLHFRQHDADLSVAAVPYTVNVPYGILDLKGRNVKGVLEKPVYNYFANAGIYLLKRSVLDEIPNRQFFNATDLIDKLIGEGKKVIRFPITGYWIDIGSAAEYQKAKDLVNHIKE
nr:nucleotidyltransferase family protein [Prevotella sp.]